MRGKYGGADARVEGIRPNGVSRAVTGKRGASRCFRHDEPQAGVALHQQVA